MTLLHPSCWKQKLLVWIITGLWVLGTTTIIVATEDDDGNGGPWETCASEKEQYANCVFRLDPAIGKACDECRIATFDNLPYDAGCDDLSTQLCNAIGSCGCDNCNDELEFFWQCTTALSNNGTCDTLSCGTQVSETPQGPLCPEQFEEYRQCVLQDLDEATRTTCDECRLQASSSIPQDEANCTVVQEIFCNSVENCNCGICSGPLESYLDCDVYKRWFGECRITCGPDSNANGSSSSSSSGNTQQSANAANQQEQESSARPGSHLRVIMVLLAGGSSWLLLGL